MKDAIEFLAQAIEDNFFVSNEEKCDLTQIKLVLAVDDSHG